MLRAKNMANAFRAGCSCQELGVALFDWSPIHTCGNLFLCVIASVNAFAKSHDCLLLQLFISEILQRKVCTSVWIDIVVSKSCLCHRCELGMTYLGDPCNAPINVDVASFLGRARRSQNGLMKSCMCHHHRHYHCAGPPPRTTWHDHMTSIILSRDTIGGGHSAFTLMKRTCFIHESEWCEISRFTPRMLLCVF